MFRSKPPAPLPSCFVSRTVLKHVDPAPLRDAALLVLIFHVVFVTRGRGWALAFTLILLTQGKTIDSSPSTLCLPFPSLSANHCFDVTVQITVMLSRIFNRSHGRRCSSCSCYHPCIWRVFFPPSWIIHCLISATPQTLAVSARNFEIVGYYLTVWHFSQNEAQHCWACLTSALCWCFMFCFPLYLCRIDRFRRTMFRSPSRSIVGELTRGRAVNGE